jgi:GT2 family glycosyltransferase
MSSGKYIVTLSVDSIPLNDLWLKSMIEPLMSDSADVVQGMMQCPEKGNTRYPDFFYWERDFGFYFTSEARAFYKKYGDFGRYGCFGLAAPNLSFKKTVWEKAKFSGVSYNEDNIFQKRIAENNFKVVFNDKAVVLHAHLYKTIKSLFNRCSNECE